MSDGMHRAQAGFVKSMQESREAQQFVNDLYLQRRPTGQGDRPDANGKSLAKALKLLSSELYTKPSHFVLELAQNADDADYAPGVEPHLSFVFREDGYLWVGSNEVGFTKENVEAICDLAGSTKTVKDHQNGFIGEKGIGFKSTFKVADCVWISSTPYKFKLGRDGLDMISPVWEKFKDTAMLKEQTMFCLRIPEKGDQINVEAELLGLNPQTLLFLRKLRKITVVIAKDETHITHEFSIRRVDNTDDLGEGYSTTQLSRSDVSPVPDTNSEALVVFRQTAQSMPWEAKRVGIEQSEIVLAFPLERSTCSRPVYNFLPIRDYGFLFLLHADFITTVNREDINHHNAWNEKLLLAATDLFVQCVKTFNRAETNEMQALRFEWPRFIKPAHTASDTIMVDFFPKLRDRLKKEPVLQSQSGHFAKPSSLNILSERWMDDSTPAAPLFTELRHLKTYVSEHYNPGDITILGPKPPPAAFFAAFLGKMSPAQLQQHSDEWHSMVATALLAAPPVAPELLERIQMIPLRDGSWVATGSSKNAIYFPETAYDVDVPNGIEVKIVETRAAEDPARKALFRRLGVQDLNTRQVCLLILEQHENLESPTSDLPVGILVDHARYLYKYKDHLDSKCLRVLKLAVAGSEIAVSGDTMYMDSILDGSFRMSEHFEQDRDCHFIHPDYFVGGPDADFNWYAWLRRSFKIHTKPDLVIQQNVVSPLAAKHDMAGIKHDLHPLFQRLVDLPDSSIWLTLLRDGWDDGYSVAYKLLPKNRLQQAPVTCRDGQRRPLNKVYWATIDVLREPLAQAGVDLLEINDHGKAWRDSGLLDTLGVSRKADLSLFFCILRKAAKGDLTVSPVDVIRLMKGIQSRTNGNESIIRNAFDSHKMVATVKDGPMSWLSLKDCKWEAPDCLHGITSLAKDYQEVKALFTGTLELDDASADDIANQLERNSGDIDELENTKALLAILSSLISQMDYPLQQLKQLQIFPVRRPDGVINLVAADDNDWFIADERRFQACFLGKISMLDWEIQDVPQLTSLLGPLGIEQKVLSRGITDEMIIPEGISKLHPELTAELQSKAGYIALLVPAQHKDGSEVKLRSLQVYTARRMTLRRYVQIGSMRVYGRDESGKAIIRDRNDSMELHCRKSAVKQQRANFHICEEVSKIFNIPAKHRETLAFVLCAPAGPAIQDVLRCKDLWDAEIPDIDDDDDDDDEEDNEDDEMDASPHAAATEEEDLPSGRGLFVSPGSTPDPSTEQNDAEAAAEETESEDEVDVPQSSSTARPHVPPSTFFTQHPPQSRRAPPRSDPHLSEIRAQAKIKREKQDIAAIAAAALRYDIEAVEVHGTPPSMNNATHPFTGLAFDETDTSEDFADQDDRIRYWGELFARGILKSQFDATDESWTSEMRTRRGLDEPEDLYESSDFTVSDEHTVGLITDWLLRRDHDPREPESEYLETSITYHIFVKATDGEPDDPFTFSNREFELAKEWSTSESDVTLVFRVYDVPEPTTSKPAPPKTPKFAVLVDPIKLMLGGKATMTALGGFLMHVT